MHMPSPPCPWVGTSLGQGAGHSRAEVQGWVVAWCWWGRGQVNQGEFCDLSQSMRLTHGMETLAAACTETSTITL